MAFIDEFAGELNDSLVAQPVTHNLDGDWTANGAPLATIPCRIEGGGELVRDAAASREVVSHLLVITNGVRNLNVRDYVYTVPSRYSPYQNLRALRVDVESDEDGTSYEVVFLGDESLAFVTT